MEQKDGSSRVQAERSVKRMDMEKVIRIIDELIFEAKKAPTWKAENALKCLKKELLKEQEPILLENQHKPYGISTNANSPWISRCPKCGKKVEGKQTKFCKYCGQAVKWE